MLRKITLGCAVVVAMLVAPATLPAHSMGSFGGMGGMGGMHSFGMASRPGACIRSVIARTSHYTTSLTFITFITSGTTSYTTSGTGTFSPPLSASAVAALIGGQFFIRGSRGLEFCRQSTFR